MTAEIPWTSVGVATGYRGNPRVSTAIANAMDVATAHPAFLARGKLRRTNHGYLRKSAVIATAASAETALAISAAIRGHCHGIAAITTTEVHGIFHGSLRGFNRSDFHGYPRPSAAIPTAILR